MSTSFTATTIEKMKNETVYNQHVCWHICEVFKDSRVLIGFWSEELGEEFVYYLNTRESCSFALSMYHGFDEIHLYAEKHIRETGCTNLVHAVLDAVYHCLTKVKHEVTRYDIVETVSLTYCMSNGCVQDSLDRMVQL